MIFKKAIVIIVFLLVGFLAYGISYEGWFLQKLDRTPDQYNSSNYHRSVRGGGFHQGK